MIIDRRTIEASFSPVNVSRGLSYFHQGATMVVTWDGDDTVFARVRGSQRQPYDVALIWDEETARLGGSCTCPVGLDCKHAVAVAFQVLAEEDPSPSQPVRSETDIVVDAWIGKLAAPATAPAAREQVHYTLSMREHQSVPLFQLDAYIVPTLKSGDLGAPRSINPRDIVMRDIRASVPTDRTIVRLADASGVFGYSHGISPTILAMLLEVLTATGRCHWKSPKSEALRVEAIDAPGIGWHLGEDGLQRPVIRDYPGALLLPSVPSWYVNPQRATIGPVAMQAVPEIAAAIAAAPALDGEQAVRARTGLRKIFASSGIEAPKIISDERIVEDEPRRILRLRFSPPPRRAGYSQGRFAYAEVRFGYGDHIVARDHPETAFRSSDGQAVTTYPRQRTFELATTASLAIFGLRERFLYGSEGLGTSSTVLGFMEPSESRWVEFQAHGLRELASDGWEIVVDDDFPYRVVEADGDWFAELNDATAQWFDLDLGIEIDGARVPLLPILLDIVKSGRFSPGQEVWLSRLPDGRHVVLPVERTARLLAVLEDLLADPESLGDGSRLRVPMVRAGDLAGFENTFNVGWSGAKGLRALFAALSSVDPRALKIPRSFKATLRPYQREGVAWLQTLRAHGFGGVLADDMGLGKTVQLLAHVAIEKAAGRLAAPVLVVAPTSVVPNWRAEAAAFVPGLRTLSLTGWDRDRRFAEIGDADIVFSTYSLLPRDSDDLLPREWSIVVLDEAQNIKNPRVKAAIVARELRAEQRLVLTGTPIENNLEDLWSVYAFAVPGLLPDRARFVRQFRTPIEKKNDVVRRQALAARVRPFFLRRTKDAVAQDLPEKTEVVQRIELAGAQRDLYEAIRLAMHKRVRDEIGKRGLARSRIIVLDALLKLRQVCCDPRLLKLPAAAGVRDSQKLDALLEMLASLIEDGRRILLFSQFTSMLDLIKPELEARGLPFVELRGDTRDRETPVRRFQSREVPLFLISLKAGGTGLNLTAADTVIHYDPWWNPAVERQATDRAHRIGQSNHVFVYKMIAEGTVEERILELQERKGDLADSLLDETSAAPLALEMDEIERLFS